LGGVERIDLAREKEFRLGGLTVRPALRQLVREDGAQEVVEPRVMQVLVALARESGGIVSRDDLTHSCWEGRVVGEDAINRVISRLRRSAEGIGQREFRIETITKVGYRLVREGVEEVAPVPANDEAAAAIAEARKLRLDRRAMLVGSGLAVTGAVGWWDWRRLTAPAVAETPPADVAELVAQARLALRQGSPDSANQATGLLKRAVEKRPDYADGWGMLAITYARGAQQAPPRFEATMRSRANEAIERALKLEPDNANAVAARIALRPSLGGWLANERDLRAGLLHHPENEYLQSMFSGLLLGVGRCREAADRVVTGWKHYSPSPGIAYGRVVCLWAADRLDEADAAANEAYALFPTQYAVWFTRVYLLMYTGRATEALAILRSVETRPEGIPDWNFDMVIDAAQAMATRAPADIDKAMASNIAGARKGTGFAENTIQYAAALGRIDTAFEIADAYYFGKAFESGDLAYSSEQRQYRRRNSRRTNLLFLPSTVAMRADKRFAALVEELGLARYWADSGMVPDYRRKG
jgi:DNA-binding winged helix-turn-helix (wHTH) protein